ncbi:MAG: hypothetical protein ACI8UZ_001800, partial [Akkermansiaceae bacterium]
PHRVRLLVPRRPPDDGLLWREVIQLSVNAPNLFSSANERWGVGFQDPEV